MKRVATISTANHSAAPYIKEIAKNFGETPAFPVTPAIPGQFTFQFNIVNGDKGLVGPLERYVDYYNQTYGADLSVTTAEVEEPALVTP